MIPDLALKIDGIKIPSGKTPLFIHNLFILCILRPIPSIFYEMSEDFEDRSILTRTGDSS